MNFLLFEVRNMTAIYVLIKSLFYLSVKLCKIYENLSQQILMKPQNIIQKFWVHEFELNHCILTTWTWLPVYIIVTAKNTLKSSSLSAQFGFLRMAAQIP